jgi:F0F1-type ATP synthase membrane subunit b/b'
MSYSDDLPPDDGEDSAPVPIRSQMTRDPLGEPDTELLLRRAADLIAAARPRPLSTSVVINKDEVLQLLAEAIDRLPEEVRAARWLMKEREEFVAATRVEGDEILEDARARAERMVQRTEVVKAAEQRARRIVDAAEAEARRLRHECEDFVDQKLASFEIVLERTMKMVQAGRDKLSGPPLAAPEADPGPEAGPVFDQFDQGQP